MATLTTQHQGAMRSFSNKKNAEYAFVKSIKLQNPRPIYPESKLLQRLLPQMGTSDCVGLKKTKHFATYTQDGCQGVSKKISELHTRNTDGRKESGRSNT